MSDFANKNWEKTKPDYFYRVRNYPARILLFEEEEGKIKRTSYPQDFKGDDLLKCRSNAEIYYYEQLSLGQWANPFYPYPFEVNSESDEVLPFKLTLSLVEFYTDDIFYEYPIKGEDETTTYKSNKMETYVLKENGYI